MTNFAACYLGFGLLLVPGMWGLSEQLAAPNPETQAWP